MKEGKEKLEIEINDLVTDSILNGKQLTISELKEKISNLAWINYTEDSGENSFNVITDKDCIYEIAQDENGKYIVIERGKNNGEPWPTISLEQLPTQGTANEKVQIKVTATVQETKKTKKVEKIINKTTGEEKEYVSGGIIFEVDENGTYEFEAVADNGKTRSAKITINVESGEIIKISAEPTTPRNTLKTEAQNGIETGPIKVSITFGNINLSNTDKYQYRIGKEGSWQTATGKNVEIDATENTIIVAKYYDGKNSIGAQNYSIQNVDNVAPDEFTPTVTPTTNSIKVTATTEDTASEGASSTTSGVEKWKYSIDNGSSWQDSSEFTGLTTGSYTIKVKAIDKAGNERVAEVSTQTESLTGGTIEITPDVTTPRNTVKTETQNGVATGPITVTITYGTTNLTNADRYQYKIGNGDWQTSSSSTISFPITENVSIATRYYDGKNAKDGTTYSIKNVDNEAPNSFTASATSDVNSITLSGTTTDAVSSGYVGDTTLTYKYSKDGSSWQDSSTITGLPQGETYTGYIKAIDKAGNERIETVSVTTLGEKVAVGDSWTFTYAENGSTPTFTLPATGKYKIELYGAAGGNLGSYSGGSGGKVQGTYSGTRNQEVQMQLSAKGSLAGYSSTVGVSGYTGSAGGAASTIKIDSTMLAIAGGGGGATPSSSGGSGGSSTSTSISTVSSPSSASSSSPYRGGSGASAGSNGTATQYTHTHNATIGGCLGYSSSSTSYSKTTIPAGFMTSVNCSFSNSSFTVRGYNGIHEFGHYRCTAGHACWSSYSSNRKTYSMTDTSSRKYIGAISYYRYLGSCSHNQCPCSGNQGSVVIEGTDYPKGTVYIWKTCYRKNGENYMSYSSSTGGSSYYNNSKLTSVSTSSGANSTNGYCVITLLELDY